MEEPFWNFKFDYILLNCVNLINFHPLEPFKFSVIRFSIYLLLVPLIEDKMKDDIYLRREKLSNKSSEVYFIEKYK